MSIYEILMVVLTVARLVFDIIKLRKENRKSRPDRIKGFVKGNVFLMHNGKMYYIGGR